MFEVTDYSDACDVTLSVYPHRASLKNMPDHGGNRTYDLCNTSPMLCQLMCGYTLRVTSQASYSPEYQTAEYVRFRRDLGGGKRKNLGAGAQKCPRGGLRGGLRGGQPGPASQRAVIAKTRRKWLNLFHIFLFSSQVNSGTTAV